MTHSTGGLPEAFSRQCSECLDQYSIEADHAGDHPGLCCDCFDYFVGMPLEAVNRDRDRRGMRPLATRVGRRLIGKPGQAPCGHLGEHVTNSFVTCPRCDRQGFPVDEDTAEIDFSDLFLEKCPKCGSVDVEPFPVGHVSWTHCLPCGAVF